MEFVKVCRQKRRTRTLYQASCLVGNAKHSVYGESKGYWAQVASVSWYVESRPRGVVQFPPES